MSRLNSRIGLLLICATILCIPACIASSLGLDIIHRYSDKGRQIFKKYGESTEFWPSRNSREYHDLLFAHDRARHGRRLQSDDPLIFSQGNLTTNLGSEFGWISYALIDVGTPNVTFLVALDTGSDLFWIPCECKQCSRINPNDYPELKAVKSKLSEYRPSLSSTSSAVSCSNSLCKLNQCSSPNEQCSYKVQYLSDNTSTSGVLVKDVVHFAHENNWSMQVQANITFGCGRVQTGIFLSGGAPNGLLGLGMGDISLPSLLAKTGQIQNSFSMCFNSDSEGRILFGDTGSSRQKTTSFLSKSAYYISIDGIQVGGTLIQATFSAIFDTGTTLTYLPTEIYDAITTSFDQQIQLQRVQISNESELYNFCYQVDSSTKSVPALILNFTGGADYNVESPYIGFVNKKDELVAICLAVLKTDSVAIIGQNFMNGYKFTFNRDTQKLGWINSTCYDENAESTAPEKALAPGKAPAPSPEASASSGSGTHAPSKTSASSGRMRRAESIRWYVAALLCVLLAI